MIKLLSVAIVAALFLESHQLRPGPFALPEVPGVPVVKPESQQLRPGPFVFPGVPVVKPGRSRPGPFALPEVPGVPVVKPESHQLRPGPFVFPGVPLVKPGRSRPGPFALPEVPEVPEVPLVKPGRSHPGPFVLPEVPEVPGVPVVKPVCWTNWFDRDNPSGTGDWEHLNDLRKEKPGKICEYPLYIEVVTTHTMTPAISTGENFHTVNPTQGFVWDQKSGGCRDYKVRFGCPCKN